MTPELRATIDAAAVKYVTNTIGPVDIYAWAERALSALILINLTLDHSPFTADICEVIDAYPAQLQEVEG